MGCLNHDWTQFRCPNCSDRNPTTTPWYVAPHGDKFRVARVYIDLMQYRQSASGRITDYKTEAAAKREAKALNDDKI